MQPDQAVEKILSYVESNDSLHDAPLAEEMETLLHEMRIKFSFLGGDVIHILNLIESGDTQAAEDMIKRMLKKRTAIETENHRVLQATALFGNMFFSMLEWKERNYRSMHVLPKNLKGDCVNLQGHKGENNVSIFLHHLSPSKNT